MMPLHDKRLPDRAVRLFGVGKTTLLNHILANREACLVKAAGFTTEKRQGLSDPLPIWSDRVREAA